MKAEEDDNQAKASPLPRLYSGGVLGLLLGSKTCGKEEKEIGLGRERSCCICAVISRETLADPARSSENGMMNLG